MISLYLAVLAQAPVPVTPPVTGNTTLDTLLYIGAGLLGLRGGEGLLQRMRQKRRAPVPSPNDQRLEEVHSTVTKIVELHGQSVEAYKDMANALDKMSTDLQDVRVRLAGIQGRLGGS